MRALYYKLRRRWLMLTMRMTGTYTHYDFGYQVTPLLIGELGGGVEGFVCVVNAAAMGDKFFPLMPKPFADMHNGTKTWLVENQGRFVPKYMAGEP